MGTQLLIEVFDADTAQTSPSIHTRGLLLLGQFVALPSSNLLGDEAASYTSIHSYIYFYRFIGRECSTEKL